MFTTIRIAVMALGLTALAACNTIEGLGEDVSAGGEAISNTADKTQKAISQ